MKFSLIHLNIVVVSLTCVLTPTPKLSATSVLYDFGVSLTPGTQVPAHL